DQGESADDGETGGTGSDRGIDDDGGDGCSCTTEREPAAPLAWLLLSAVGLGLVRRRHDA
ncbi:MAG TPA: MYXO-CTERM sorting domain-containing protein, partial [Enhygromyxa sp.]|nr:MYXO-CTERM sorting domain-containing protein [Enhygromyxa sp.]